MAHSRGPTAVNHENQFRPRVTSMETAQADGTDNRGNGVQFPAQAIDFSLFDMVMTGIGLFKKNFSRHSIS